MEDNLGLISEPHARYRSPKICDHKRRPKMTLCEDCQFYVPARRYTSSGHCRRYPPQAYGMTFQFPQTHKHMWCGEAKAVEEPENAPD